MGDRTDCNLTLLGEIKRNKLVRIDDIVRDEGGDCNVEDGEYIFTGVNHATIPEPVRTAIVDAGLSYIWSHGSGYEYGEGCVMWDAAEQQGMSFSTNSEGLVVPVSWALEECEMDRAALKGWVQLYARMQTGEELTVIEDNDDDDGGKQESPLVASRVYVTSVKLAVRATDQEEAHDHLREELSMLARNDESPILDWLVTSGCRLRGEAEMGETGVTWFPHEDEGEA